MYHLDYKTKAANWHSLPAFRIVEAVNNSGSNAKIYLDGEHRNAGDVMDLMQLPVRRDSELRVSIDAADEASAHNLAEVIDCILKSDE